MNQSVSILAISEGAEKEHLKELLVQIAGFDFDWNPCESLDASLALLETQKFNFVFLHQGKDNSINFNALKSIARRASPSSLVLMGDLNETELDKLWEFEAVLDHFPSGEISLGQFQKILRIGLRQQSLINARKQSDYRYDRLVDLNPEPIIVTELETGIITSVNEAFCLKFDWTENECLGKSALELGIWLNVEDRDKLLRSLPKIGRLTNQSLHLKNKDGISQSYKCSFTTFEDSGRHFLMGLLIDLSEIEEKQAELEAHQFAIDQHNMAVITDLDGRIKFINDNFCAVSGYGKEELIGNSTRILQSGVHPESFFKELWETVSSGKVWRGNICNRHKNGNLYWLATTIIPYRNSQGEIIEYIALRTDISDLKATEQALVTSEKYLSNVINSTPHVVWAIDLDYKLRSFNDNFRAQFKHFFNYDLEYGDAMDNLSIFPQEFLDQWNERYQKAFEGEVCNYFDTFPNPATGLEQHFAITIYPTLNENGAIVGANIFSQDVTERERAKSSLEESNRKLIQVQNMAKVGDWSYDTQKRQFGFSENLALVIGAKSKEDVPTSLRALLRKTPSKHHPSLMECLRRVFHRQEIGQNIWSIYAQSGAEIWLECHTIPELDSEGALCRIRGVVRDVTDLVRLQNLETEQKAMFAKLAANGPDLLRLNELPSVYQRLTKAVFEWFDQEVVVGTAKISQSENEESRFRINSLELPSQYRPYLQPVIDSMQSLATYPSVPETKKRLAKNQVLDFSPDLIDKLNFISPLQASFIQERFPSLSLKAIGLNITISTRALVSSSFLRERPQFTLINF